MPGGRPYPPTARFLRNQMPMSASRGHLPVWNFAKYVIDRKGQIVAFFPSEVTPEAPELRNAITKALAQN